MNKKWLRNGILVIVLLGASLGVAGCAATLPTLDPAKLEPPIQDTIIIDKTNNVKTAVHVAADKGEPVNFAKLPIYMKEAIISIEDRQFYDHSGIDFRSIARAVYRDILTGSKAEGASTITQQLAKNAFLDQDKTFTRKIKEIFLAAQIERSYTKDEILEMYMDKVNFHPRVLGLEAAAKIYFGKSADQVTLPEAAYLAGLPQAPSTYYPGTEEGKKAGIERQHLVLKAMLRDNYITQQQYDQALKTPLQFVNLNKPVGQKYPDYVEYVLKEASEKYNIPTEQILRGGLKIYTNLDPNAQQIAEKEFSNPANFPPNAADGTKVQSGMVITDGTTGGVLAVVGSRDTQAFMDKNHATSIQRSPGSSLKPIMVYAPAIDTGKYGPYSLINDKEGTTFLGGYSPHDWDYHKTIKRGDKVTLTEALQWSFNIPAASLLNEIGVNTGKVMAEKAGIQFDPNDQYLGLALGAMQYGVSPLNMADAFGAFVNKGNRIPAHAINKIETFSGSVIAQANVSPIRVMKESTANTMNSLLQNVVTSGTGTSARIPGRQIAGKTGTTEFGTSGNTDAWFVGYSPQLVGAIWMGFDYTDAAHNLKDTSTMTASSYPARLFSKVMSQVLNKYPNSTFAGPPIVQKPKEEKKPVSAITDLKAKWSQDGKSVELSWTPIDGSPDLTYFIFRADNANGKAGESGMIGFSKAGTFVDTEVDPSHGYFYAITIQDAKTGKESKSNIVSLPPFKAQSQPVEPPKDNKKKQKQPTEPLIPPLAPTQPPAQPPTQGTGSSSKPSTP